MIIVSVIVMSIGVFEYWVHGEVWARISGTEDGADDVVMKGAGFEVTQ